MPDQKPKTVSASRVAAAVGLDKSLSRYDCFREIAFGERKPIDEFTQHIIDWGRENEPTAIAYAEVASGSLFGHTLKQQRFRKGRYTGQTDGLNPWQVLEVKCRAPEHEAYVTGDHNFTKCMCQVQQYMWLSDRSEAIFACWHLSKGKSRCWKVLRSDEYVEKLHELLEEFLGFVDAKDCPKRIAKRPKMPFVQTQLIDGPPEPVLDQNAVLSDIRKHLVKATTLRRIDNLADRMLEQYPDYGSVVMTELTQARNVIEQKQAQDPRVEEEEKARAKRAKVRGPENYQDIDW